MAKKTKKSDLEKLSFEQSIETLTEIVDKIETGQVPLAESLEQYEKGMSLIKHCRKILLDAEKRIDQIAADDEPGESDDRLDDEDEDMEDDDEDNSLF